jgi:hypothetical protein
MGARMGKYQERQRDQDARAGIKKRKGRQFLLLYTNVKRSVAYHGLSRHARSLLFELIDRYTGINNGFIGLGVREAKYELHCSEGTVCNAMRELDDAGLAQPTKIGSFRGKKATEWRLMFLRCNKTQEPAVTKWEQRTPYSLFSQDNAKAQPEQHREPHCSATTSQKAKSSIRRPTHCSVRASHIDIYQGPGGTVGLTPKGEVLATSLSETEFNQGPSFGGGSSARPKSTTKSKKGAA